MRMLRVRLEGEARFVVADDYWKSLYHPGEQEHCDERLEKHTRQQGRSWAGIHQPLRFRCEGVLLDVI